MSDPTAHAKLIERLIEKVITDVCDLPDRNSPEGQPDMMLVTGAELDAIIRSHIDSLSAAPGLVPLPEKLDPRFADELHATDISHTHAQTIYELFYERFATPAPLAAQSHDQAIMKAAEAIYEYWRAMLIGTDGKDRFAMPQAQAMFGAIDAKRAAQSPSPRGERIERSGKDRRLVKGGRGRYEDRYPDNERVCDMSKRRTGKDRRAQPQSGDDHG